MISHYTYLISALIVFVFIGLVIYARYRHIAQWRQHRHTVWVIILASFIYSLTEYPALHWHAWQYNSDRVTGLTLLGIPTETYFFTFTIFFLVSLATLAMADKLERDNR
ncbi:hypothetical protein A2V68_01205 [candidate division Kazan bacterium RBG_13_50_9]|uniref:Lycopene cyclase domain-containing protein n=1 Tax=candidate division Kazan bacterium RBG_13_50_9 TaxID=1798535 RepID=A0A1F4NTX6_UNCK3|nr:MAG: hypothetical protein A2V68_01205 [candidate division Kazan bacterium RBG_13_50_9]